MKWPDDYIPEGFTPYHIEEAGIIFNCDCRDILPHLPKVDLVLTDPPYGVTANKWDTAEVSFQVFDLIKSPIICTSKQPFTSLMVVRYLNNFKWADVFEKSHATGFLNCKAMPMRKHEDILYFGDIKFKPYIMPKHKWNIRPHGKTGLSSCYGHSEVDQSRKRTIGRDETYSMSIIKFDRDQTGLHPTQKPQKLFEYLLSIATEINNIILDPFLGSGTTAVAAKELGRKFIGIEISEEYCAIAVKRLRQGVLSF